MVGAVEAGYLVILAVLGLSSLLNIYYLLEPLSRAFFREKTKNVEVKFHLLVVIPPVLTALISIGLFFYDEIFLDLAILASRGQQ
jgi:multicomponent Na+:H+ antiporter subunit D